MTQIMGIILFSTIQASWHLKNIVQNNEIVQICLSIFQSCCGHYLQRFRHFVDDWFCRSIAVQEQRMCVVFNVRYYSLTEQSYRLCQNELEI